VSFRGPFEITDNDIISDHNRAVYSDPRSVVPTFGRLDVYPAEARIFERIARSCAGLPILEIGVGGGRAVPSMVKLSGDYLGIDYSDEMIRRCRDRFPTLRFEVADARDLSRLSAEHYAFVLFSFQGIDYVSHAHRLLILREVHRVLRDGGWFALSSHNRLSSRWHPSKYRFGLTGLLLKILGAGFTPRCYLRGALTWWHSRGALQEEAEYTYRTDFRDNLITYYIESVYQVSQLHHAGFEVKFLFNRDGEAITVGSADTSPFIYYLARKLPDLKPMDATF
jgi:SAM-dependent methyltransferase